MSRVEEIDFEIEMLNKEIEIATDAIRKHDERIQKSFLGKVCRFFSAPYRFFKQQWQKGNFFGVIFAGIICALATATLICPLFSIIGTIKRMNDDDKRIVLENKQMALVARKSELQAEKDLIVENDSINNSKMDIQKRAEEHFAENYANAKVLQSSTSTEDLTMTLKKTGS